MLIDKTRALPLPADSMKAKRALKQSHTTEQVDQIAEDFEAVFLSQMLEHLFSGVGDDDPFRGPGSDIYKSMMLQEYGKMIAKTGGIGVADHVKRELLRTQEVNYEQPGQHRYIARPDRSN